MAEKKCEWDENLFWHRPINAVETQREEKKIVSISKINYKLHLP